MGALSNAQGSTGRQLSREALWSPTVPTQSPKMYLALPQKFKALVTPQAARATSPSGCGILGWQTPVSSAGSGGTALLYH